MRHILWTLTDPAIPLTEIMHQENVIALIHDIAFIKRCTDIRAIELVTAYAAKYDLKTDMGLIESYKLMALAGLEDTPSAVRAIIVLNMAGLDTIDAIKFWQQITQPVLSNLSGFSIQIEE